MSIKSGTLPNPDKQWVQRTGHMTGPARSETSIQSGHDQFVQPIFLVFLRVRVRTYIMRRFSGIKYVERTWTGERLHVGVAGVNMNG